MQVNVLARNYFERKGTFADIAVSPIGDVLTTAAETEGKELNQLLFSAIGFRDRDEFEVEAQKMRKLCETEFLRLCNTEIKSWDESDVFTAALILLKSNLNVKKMNSAKRNFVCNVIALNCWLSQMSEVEISSSIFGVHSVATLMETIKVADTRISEVNKFTKEIIERLKNYEVSTNNKAIAIVGTDVKLLPVPGVKPKVMLAAAVKFTTATKVCKHIPLSKRKLENFFMADYNAEAYKQMLVLAEALGTTYSEIVQLLGINVSDQAKAFSYTGSDLTVLGDLVWRHSDSGLTNLPLELFISRVNGAEYDQEPSIWINLSTLSKEVTSFV